MLLGVPKRGFGSHPCRVVSSSYQKTVYCHGRGREFESRRPRHFFQALRRNRQKLSGSTLVQIKKDAPEKLSAFRAFWSNLGPGIRQLPTSCRAPSSQPCSAPVVFPRSRRTVRIYQKGVEEHSTVRPELGRPRAIVLVNACCRTLTAFS